VCHQSHTVVINERLLVGVCELAGSFELLDLSQQCVLASTHHFTNLSVVLHIGEETRESTSRTVSEVALSLQQCEHAHCIHEHCITITLTASSSVYKCCLT
jgi:hypothetical protein